MEYDRVLIEAALSAREKAYAPYSGYTVGAALRCQNGMIYSGCNIENAAYSPTNCAERTAVFKAVSEGERDFCAIAIVAGKRELSSPLPSAASPCGVCRQVLAEFCAKDFRILLAKSPQEYQAFELGELLPLQFSKDNL